MPKGVLEKAMDLLALRPLSAFELRTKLTASGRYGSAEIDETVNFCRERGYLNDALLAADTAQFLNTSGRGRGMIRKKLRLRGVGQEEITEALEQFSREDELAAARCAAEGKMRLLIREKDMRKKREKLFRFLISRGFSPDIAGNMMHEFLSSSEEYGFPDSF